jgi:predicted nuclease with TOPRIM domain
MTSKHIMNCPSCFKTFKRTGCYEKHIFLCQRRDEEIIPNNKQLWDMITSLTEKYNNVQSELESLKRKISIQNKKIDILEWLNRTSKNNSNNNWDDVMSNFEVKIIDL